MSWGPAEFVDVLFHLSLVWVLYRALTNRLDEKFQELEDVLEDLAFAPSGPRPHAVAEPSDEPPFEVTKPLEVGDPISLLRPEMSPTEPILPHPRPETHL